MDDETLICKVICPACGDVLVTTSDIVIDLDAEVYRFTCPACTAIRGKVLNDDVFDVLASVGVRTIDEMCASFEALLESDAALSRWLIG